MAQELSSSKFRNLSGVWNITTRILLCAVPIITLVWIFNVPQYFHKAVYSEQFFGLLVAVLLTLGFLTIPATNQASKDKVPWYDILFAVLSIIGGGYVLVFYPEVVFTLGIITPIRIILGIIVILFILEVTRRSFGWALVILCLVLIFYARFSYLFPGPFAGRGYPWDRIISFVYLDPSAIFGSLFAIVFGIVFSFIFFGQGLFVTGGGAFFAEFAMSLMGKYRGGAGKVAMIASGLFGMISGSATANVSMTGSITIPMMKSAGYRPQFAAAVESVAASGGLIMPPVMGAAAFIIAEFLNISYREVAISGILPALAYYSIGFLTVDLEAAKTGLRGLPSEQLPLLKKVLMKGWIFVVPLLAIIYLLFILSLSGIKSALYALATVIIVSSFRKETRFTATRLLACLEKTGSIMLDIGILTAMIGIVLGLLELTGLGLLLSQILVEISKGNIYFLLLLSAIVSTILGMGMPSVPAYLFLAILAAPSLVNAGLKPLAAHLFVFYFSILSFITPPVCPAVFVASSIAGSKIIPTGFTAIRIGIAAYIVPFIFVFYPPFLLMGNIGVIGVLSLVKIFLGLFMIPIAFQGYLFCRLNLPKRILFCFGAIGLLVSNLIINIIALFLILCLLFWEWRQRREIKNLS